MTEFLIVLAQAQDVASNGGVPTPVWITILTMLATALGGLFVRHERIRDRNEDRLVEQNRELVTELRTLQKVVIDDVVPALVRDRDSMRDLASEVREWYRNSSRREGR